MYLCSSPLPSKYSLHITYLSQQATPSQILYEIISACIRRRHSSPTQTLQDAFIPRERAQDQNWAVQPVSRLGRSLLSANNKITKITKPKTLSWKCQSGSCSPTPYLSPLLSPKAAETSRRGCRRPRLVGWCWRCLRLSMNCREGPEQPLPHGSG